MLELVRFAQQGRCRCRERAPDHGEVDSAAIAVEQPNLGVALDGLDAARECRLRDAQLLCRLRVAQQAREHDHVPENAKFHIPRMHQKSAQNALDTTPVAAPASCPIVMSAEVLFRSLFRASSPLSFAIASSWPR